MLHLNTEITTHLLFSLFSLSVGLVDITGWFMKEPANNPMTLGGLSHILAELKEATQDNLISTIFVPAPMLLPFVKRQLAKHLIRRRSHEVIELVQLPYCSITGEMLSPLYVPVYSCTRWYCFMLLNHAHCNKITPCAYKVGWQVQVCTVSEALDPMNS